MRTVILLLLALSALAHAHGGHLELEDARIVVRGAQAFLEARLVYTETDPLALTAVTAGGVTGVLEERQENGYAAVPRIELRPGTLRIGPETRVRVRFEAAELEGPTVPVTLLVTPGGLVTLAVPLEGGGSGPGRRGLGAALVAATLIALILFGHYTRSRSRTP